MKAHVKISIEVEGLEVQAVHNEDPSFKLDKFKLDHEGSFELDPSEMASYAEALQNLLKTGVEMNNSPRPIHKEDN